MINAVQAAVAERGHDLLAEDLEELISNHSSAFRGKPERFKLWPSKHDRPAFAQAMDPKPGWEGEHRITSAHEFFSNENHAWLTGTPDDDSDTPPGFEQARAAALSATLRGFAGTSNVIRASCRSDDLRLYLIFRSDTSS